MSYCERVEWIVVGAGLQGVHLVGCLRERGVAVDQIALLDRYPAPLHLWNQHTGLLEMGYMRSTAVHHLDVSPFSFVDFASEQYGEARNWSAPPYHRPKYEIFQEHCRAVLARHRVSESFRQREVQRVQRELGGGFRITADRGVFKAAQVVLAVGQPRPHFPAWASPEDPRVQHLLSPSFAPVRGRVVVIGGGMTAVQYCLAHCHEWEQATLVMPRSADISDFDADPCWIGPKCRKEFETLPPEAKRREIIAARRGGTVNPQVLECLKHAQEEGSIQVKLATAEGLENQCLFLSSGEVLEFDQLVLGTGFEQVRPGGAMVDRLIDELALPVAPCGFPLTSPHLEWAEGLYVMGGLAELTIGPVARNITGGRSAADLILRGISRFTAIPLGGASAKS